MTTTVTGHRLCARCQYDLEGLDAAGMCPECALPIADSLRGMLLAGSSLTYLRRLRTGLSCALNAILIQVAMYIGFYTITYVGLWRSSSTLLWSPFLLPVGSFVISLLSSIGYYLYTSPDPQYHGVEPARSRQVVRGAVYVQLAAAIFGLVMRVLTYSALPLALPPGPQWLFVLMNAASGFAWVVQIIAVLTYTAWLASRIPDAKIARRARRLRVWIPIIVVSLGAFAATAIPLVVLSGGVSPLTLIAILGLAYLLTLAVYWNFLNQMRTHIRGFILINETTNPQQM
ncbi:hypothetical protein BH11PLA1_BH11PLA1_08500 [soil metagenome]